MLSPLSIRFLSNLSVNNNREWFLENKKAYESYKKDYLILVAQILDQMKAIDPTLIKLEVKDCVFRINRDIRFSKDKTPYKTHLGIWLSSGQKSENKSGYYLHISPETCFVAGGIHSPEAADLKKLRREIAFFHDELEEILSAAEFKKYYPELDKESSLKSAPKDYDKDHPAIAYLKLRSLTVTHFFNVEEVTKPDFVKKVVDLFRPLKPLNDFINRALSSEDQ